LHPKPGLKPSVLHLLNQKHGKLPVLAAFLVDFRKKCRSLLGFYHVLPSKNIQTSDVQQLNGFPSWFNQPPTAEHMPKNLIPWLALRHCRWLPPNKLNHQQAEARQGQTAT
jgi:hypothetical protein